MEAELILCDTDVIIEYYRKNISVIQLCNQLGFENLLVSNITITELQQWAITKDDLRQINKRIDKFPVVDIDLNISAKYNSLFETYILSHRSQIPDTLIAATALTFDLQLFTLNTKHFQFFKGIRLIEHQLKPLYGKSTWWQ